MMICDVVQQFPLENHHVIGKSSIKSSINGTLPWDYLIEKTEHIKSTMIGKYWGNRLWLFNW